MSKTLKVSVGSFSLQSKWRYAKEYVPETIASSAKKTNTGYKLVYGPTSSSKTVKIKYSLPSGAKIKSAKIFAKISSGNSISVCNVNGNSFSVKSGAYKGASVKLSTTNGTLSAVFKYRASGGLYKDEVMHTGTCKFGGVYLLVEYDGGAAETKATNTQKKKAKGYPVPPQGVCIYDQEDGSIYMFDGVTKVNHTLAVDLQEEPDNSKKEFVNNAKNTPDKLTIDVLMSDVYTGGGAIVSKGKSLSSAQKKSYNKTKGSLIQSEVKNSWSRSAVAFQTLHWLKEQRRKLSVITPQFVHVDMIIVSVTVNQDDGTPYGWEGQIGFQHAFKPKPKKKKKNANTTPAKRTESGINQTIGH